ncbi:hypothetical protein CYV19_12985 [Natronobacterium gregoryi SP2]|uniref:Uncharacterized protein n=1 Tax=Natronobacterium gregoryi (strain ATCC 43098 / DSM 3393 / CCM 3738 / CIP 104747 / IAM 13177 / JCM 8860 / NBRC 102187 / NCIMB 2189 / SP2) TaxID=797304 RepID=L9YEL1_NATGS|nr:hypothetical protein C490_03133 [Natronobacterium gregoryi SP2]PLK19817.1 hypothetical protein CYV19_12985 [Natronobacterium gregoryi SP2]
MLSLCFNFILIGVSVVFWIEVMTVYKCCTVSDLKMQPFTFGNICCLDSHSLPIDYIHVPVT